MNATRHNLVVGLGKSGLACVRHLVARGEQVTVCDSRDAPPMLAALRMEFPQVEARLGGFPGDAFADAGRVVLSPGVDRRLLPLVTGIPVVGEIELFAQAAAAPVAAVTGTNGKSTVVTLLGEMATQAGRRVLVGGNLGTPALDLLDAPAPEFFVIELSSYQLETTRSLNASAAVVLNVSPHHLDRYADFADYLATKARIYDGDGVMVLNRDDPAVMSLARAGRETLTFGLDAPDDGAYGVVERDAAPWLARGGEALLPAAALRIPGRHNLANALAALALGEALALPRAACLDALLAYRGLPHRLEWVGEADDVRWYNDSKATNPGATAAALGGLEGPLVLIAGGQPEPVDYAPLGAAAAGKLRAVLLVGDDVTALERVLAPVAPLERAADMEAAVARARELAVPGDNVLLSPACASFDRYRDFEQRGARFATAVRELLGATAEHDA
jgi:UDP-N-acetylmuramoylalanine--D-glutamate ligase